MINPCGALMNCSFCGRDTRAKSGICGRCLGSGPSIKFGGKEQAGRKARSMAVVEGSPFDDHEEDPEYNREYHGPSPRDDI